MNRFAGAVGTVATVAAFVGASFVYTELGLPWAGGFVLGVVLFAWGLSKLLRRDESEQEGGAAADALAADPFSERRNPNQTAWLAVVGGVVVLAVVAGAFATRGEGDIGRIRDANEAARAGDAVDIDPELTATIHANDLRAGDCFNSPYPIAAGDVGELTMVLCSAGWEYIVIDSYEMQRDGAYPGLTFFEDESVRCDSWMTNYLYPHEESWGDGERTIDCLMDTEALFSPAASACFALAGHELLLITRTSLVACEEPHIVEAFASLRHPGLDFPRQLAMDAYAEDECIREFDTYVGMPFEESEIFEFHFTPSRGTWELLGHRQIECFLYLPDPEQEFQTMTGSLRNARR